MTPHQQLILDRIDFAKNNDHLSDSQTVEALLKGVYVFKGKDGWYWLRKWYERKLLEAEETYKRVTNEIAKSIDDINQREKKRAAAGTD